MTKKKSSLTYLTGLLGLTVLALACFRLLYIGIVNEELSVGKHILNALNAGAGTWVNHVAYILLAVFAWVSSTGRKRILTVIPFLLLACTMASSFYQTVDQWNSALEENVSAVNGTSPTLYYMRFLLMYLLFAVIVAMYLVMLFGWVRRFGLFHIVFFALLVTCLILLLVNYTPMWIRAVNNPGDRTVVGLFATSISASLCFLLSVLCLLLMACLVTRASVRHVLRGAEGRRPAPQPGGIFRLFAVEVILSCIMNAGGILHLVNSLFFDRNPDTGFTDIVGVLARTQTLYFVYLIITIVTTILMIVLYIVLLSMIRKKREGFLSLFQVITLFSLILYVESLVMTIILGSVTVSGILQMVFGIALFVLWNVYFLYSAKMRLYMGSDAYVRSAIVGRRIILPGESIEKAMAAEQNALTNHPLLKLAQSSARSRQAAQEPQQMPAPAAGLPQFCIKCGTPLKPGMAFCTNCGYNNAKAAASRKVRQPRSTADTLYTFATLAGFVLLLTGMFLTFRQVNSATFSWLTGSSSSSGSGAEQSIGVSLMTSQLAVGILTILFLAIAVCLLLTGFFARKSGMLFRLAPAAALLWTGIAMLIARATAPGKLVAQMVESNRRRYGGLDAEEIVMWKERMRLTMSNGAGLWLLTIGLLIAASALILWSLSGSRAGRGIKVLPPVVVAAGLVLGMCSMLPAYRTFSPETLGRAIESYNRSPVNALSETVELSPSFLRISPVTGWITLGVLLLVLVFVVISMIRGRQGALSRTVLTIGIVWCVFASIVGGSKLSASRRMVEEEQEARYAKAQTVLLEEYGEVDPERMEELMEQSTYHLSPEREAEYREMYRMLLMNGAGRWMLNFSLLIVILGSVWWAGQEKNLKN
ncbi:MAG: DUF2569 family protein [Lachnospiraceae bacterium]|nr:DUF2569 family protein [Lachnospiraceae bacterium]